MKQYSEPNLLEPKDIYYYINEEKKVIIFERNDQRQFRVKVPISLRNNELYYTAMKYKINEFSDMDLFYDKVIILMQRYIFFFLFPNKRRKNLRKLLGNSLRRIQFYDYKPCQVITMQSVS